MTFLRYAVLLMAIVAAAVFAYDFHDPYFNEFLADELEDWDLLSSQNQVRYRRSPIVPEEDDDKLLKCKHHYGKMCCGKGRWLKNFADTDKKSVMDCFSSFNQKMNASGISAGSDPFSCDKVNQMKMKVICTSECVGIKQNLVKKDGSINTDNVANYLEKLELESWQRSLLNEAIAKCAPLTNSTSVTTPSTGNIECNPVMLSLQHCTFLEVEKYANVVSKPIPIKRRKININCPQEQKKTEGKCRKLHDRIKSNHIYHLF